MVEQISEKDGAGEGVQSVLGLVGHCKAFMPEDAGEAARVFSLQLLLQHPVFISAQHPLCASYSLRGVSHTPPSVLSRNSKSSRGRQAFIQ